MIEQAKFDYLFSALKKNYLNDNTLKTNNTKGHIKGIIHYVKKQYIKAIVKYFH